MQSRAIRLYAVGGPEQMMLEDVTLGEPGAGEALVRHSAIGLNFIDIYHRSGLYKLPLPTGLGVEAAGVVEAVGAGVSHVAVGDRVVYAGSAPGAYADARVMAADKLVKLPPGIADAVAASAFLQGLTVQFLLRRCFPVKAGQTILLHAAAGGVGLLACQWAKALGVTVIGTVGSDEKAELARAHGCTHPIVYTREDFVQRVREITDGAGVPVVYDSVGKDTFMGSLDCLAPMGMFVSFGNASGTPPPFELSLLAQKGSLFVTRPTLFTYTAKRSDLEAMSADLFAVLESGAVQVQPRQTYPLADVARAHEDMAARRTVGSSILLPA